MATEIPRTDTSMYHMDTSVYLREFAMDMQIAKWGNSLALRIPSEIVRRLGLREGDTVDARITIDGALTIRPGHWSRAAFADEVTQARETMPMGESVIEELRGGARY